MRFKPDDDVAVHHFRRIQVALVAGPRDEAVEVLLDLEGPPRFPLAGGVLFKAKIHQAEAVEVPPAYARLAPDNCASFLELGIEEIPARVELVRAKPGPEGLVRGSGLSCLHRLEIRVDGRCGGLGEFLGATGTGVEALDLFLQGGTDGNYFPRCGLFGVGVEGRRQQFAITSLGATRIAICPVGRSTACRSLQIMALRYEAAGEIRDTLADWPFVLLWRAS